MCSWCRSVIIERFCGGQGWVMYIMLSLVARSVDEYVVILYCLVRWDLVGVASGCVDIECLRPCVLSFGFSGGACLVKMNMIG